MVFEIDPELTLFFQPDLVTDYFERIYEANQTSLITDKLQAQNYYKRRDGFEAVSSSMFLLFYFNMDGR